MRKRVISWLLALSMALSPSYLMVGAAPVTENQGQAVGAVLMDQEGYEAEDAELLGEAKNESVYSGYSGSGYTALVHSPGDGVQFSNITVPQDGDYTVFVK